MGGKREGLNAAVQHGRVRVRIRLRVSTVVSMVSVSNVGALHDRPVDGTSMNEECEAVIIIIVERKQAYKASIST